MEITMLTRAAYAYAPAAPKISEYTPDKAFLDQQVVAAFKLQPHTPKRALTSEDYPSIEPQSNSSPQPPLPSYSSQFNLYG